MGTIEVIKRFVESNWILEKAAREVVERLPLRFRYGISYGPTFRHWLGFLKESERWDRNRLEEYQMEQLRDLLIHAGRNVPYYRTLFGECGFRPDRVQSLDDITMLPFLERMTIHDRKEQFIAGNIQRKALIPSYTSGTSGIPLVVYATKETEEKHWATIVNLWGRAGYAPKAKTVFFTANIRRGSKDNLPWNRYGNTLVLSSNYMVNEWLEKYVHMLSEFHPEYLVGFPHTIAVFCSYLLRSKTRFMFDGLRGVIVYAENIYEWQREIIERVLGVRVFSDYGMVEKVIHGGACENSPAFHLYPQYGFTEYVHLHDARYELVGTGFINYAMPLIRYKTGDLCTGAVSSCSECGRNYDTITLIEGRMGDFLITMDGRIVSVYLDIDFTVLANIRRFQLYQELPGVVELKVWPQGSFRSNDAQKILHEVRRSLGSNASNIVFDLKVIDGGSPHLPGKYRMVDQRLNIRAFL